MLDERKAAAPAPSARHAAPETPAMPRLIFTIAAIAASAFILWSAIETTDIDTLARTLAGGTP